ncbi:MAG: sigma-54-dependent Fis family transcriptional regulator, partial [Desulfobacteraceae bacterium]
RMSGYMCNLRRTIENLRIVEVDAARNLLPYEGPERRRNSPLITLEELERRHIEHVLEATNGNRPKAAKILGINVSTIYRKLEKYHLTDKNFESN